ncbi:hypothetical protein PSPO01_00216 [Paraphaeosphaeria sporulosa]
MQLRRRGDVQQAWMGSRIAVGCLLWTDTQEHGADARQPTTGEEARLPTVADDSDVSGGWFDMARSDTAIGDCGLAVLVLAPGTLSKHYRFSTQGRAFYFSSTQRLPRRRWDRSRPTTAVTTAVIARVSRGTSEISRSPLSSCALAILRPHCTSKIHGDPRRRLFLRPLEPFLRRRLPRCLSARCLDQPNCCALTCVPAPVHAHGRFLYPSVAARPALCSDTHLPAACRQLELRIRASTPPGQFPPHHRRRWRTPAASPTTTFKSSAAQL